MPLRLLFTAGLVIAAIALLLLILLATDTALSVWARLAVAPLWLQLSYAGGLLVFIGSALWLSYRLFRPTPEKAEPAAAAPDAAALQEELLSAAGAGIDIEQALEEAREHRVRKQAGTIHLALFGEINAGKSSLAGALLPHADVDRGVLGGTTRTICRYLWETPYRDRILISDLPGFNDASAEDISLIRDEAMRAHLVIFLCDADIGRAQYEYLDELKKTSKPILVALNKTDRFADTELVQIREKLAATTGISNENIVAVSTGGTEEVVHREVDGSEHITQRQREPEIKNLQNKILALLDANRELIESLRDSASLALIAEKLDDAITAHRREQADALVRKYSKRAVLGAMAAITPGSDLVIQGALATGLINELCKVFEVRVRDVEVDRLLRLAGGTVRKMTAISLAISGNVLKAFPGVGTVSGGLLHAVAYGMIFDSLGRAVSATLASRGELRAYPAAASFEELMSENIRSRAQRFAQLALAAPDKSGDAEKS